MNFIKKILFVAFSNVLFFSVQIVAQNVKPSDVRGMYAIWYGEDTSMLSLPFIRGGQIVVQWADLEPAEGKFDFSSIDKQLKLMKSLGKTTTVQVNGNKKPKWLYNKVPTHPEKLSHQIGDDEGTLMYWHPNFKKAYTDFLKAYATHLKKSPYLAMMVGIRMNFNALGTEHFPVPKEKRSLDQWKVPKGVAQGIEWTDQVSEDYQTMITDEYIKDFDGIKVFMRNNLPKEMVEKYRKKFEAGNLMLFHTSSEMEPRGPKPETNYGLFYEFCKSGKTLAYAEPWADAWGHHGNQIDKRWTGPSQWTYWRVLSDLNSGVSLIAVYTNDLRVAQLGIQRKGADVQKYRGEFAKSFKFGALYAGYQASPEVSPGAWVAFRHNDKNRMTNNELKQFTGDYTFLMKQVGDDETIWKDVINVGNENQRFGAWSKVLPEGKKIKLELSNLFATSIKGKSSTIKVIYLDSTKGGSFEIAYSNQKIKTNLEGTRKWKTLEIPIYKSDFSKDASAAQITLTSLSGNTVFHMVNVERGNGVPSDVKNVSALFKNKQVKIRWQNSLDYDIDKIAIYKGAEIMQAIPAYDAEVTINNITKNEANQLIIKTIDEAGRVSEGVKVSLN
jgi:hypothetical protein